MDPDATLADILWTVDEYQAGNRDLDLDLLMEQIRSLDVWLAKGGFRPLRWRQA